ncbi:MAG: ATPase [Hyperionvirus sp.]|uniref:ATPase n=1 Tax=Hyperionvirus sp. TaxID=2487770 RepID=A0A3G5A9Z5_9VIRU|nr:MAG: ATPase [Hyperionvirus sp.]
MEWVYYFVAGVVIFLIVGWEEGYFRNIRSNVLYCDDDFKAVERDGVSESGEKVKSVYVIVVGDALKNVLMNTCNMDELYRNPICIELGKFVDIHNQLEGKSVCAGLVQFVRDNFDGYEEFERMSGDKVISFPLLKYLLYKGRKIIVKCPVGRLGGVIESAYESFGRFYVEIGIVKYVGGAYYESEYVHVIQSFKGTRRIDSMDFEFFEGRGDLLEKRGKCMVRMTGNVPLYLRCSGDIAVDFKGTGEFVTGNVMIDPLGYEEKLGVGGGFNLGEKLSLEDVEGKMWMIYPTIGGYSFNLKGWYMFNIEKLEEVKFQDNLLDTLVMPKETGFKKDIMLSFIKNIHLGDSGVGSSDFMKTKGGGIIFLLHGPPGVGKTHTAEAIAEVLHKPLYSLTSGELGSTTREIETKLKDVLNNVTRWKAVLLIDEADAFMQERVLGDTKRNSLVCTFLKLLEYHNGIIILTTNRVQHFDDAVYSRIHFIISYPDLDTETRKEVWKKLCDNNDIKLDYATELDDLAKYKLNGRQIRNVINMAKCYSASENRVVSYGSIMNIILLDRTQGG